MLMADLEIPSKVLIQQLASAIKMVCQVARLQDGSRKITSIAEVVGVEDGRVMTQDIFFFERTGMSPDGKVQGRFRWSGVQPKILDRLRMAGIKLRPDIFDEVVEGNL